MPYSEPEEIIRVQKLIQEAKFEAASQILDKFSEKEDLTLHELTSYYLAKSWIAAFLSNQEDCIKYASEAYRKSRTLEDSLILLDCNIMMILVLLWQKKLIEARELIANT